MEHTESPVIVALYVPGTEEKYEQDTNEGVVTGVGHDTESAGGAEVVSVTVPEKPERLAKVMVPWTEEPAASDTMGDVML